MTMLTAAEKEFLDVFLYEATNSPFTGPATRALHSIGVEYHDLSSFAWAYDHEVPRDSFVWGHPADVAPPLPWPDRDAVRLRSEQIQRIREQQDQPAHTPTGE
jgi:hypothetical protein